MTMRRNALAVRLGAKGAADLLGVSASAWHRMERAERFERLGKLWFMPHVGTLGFSIDKDGNEKINLYNINAASNNAS